MQILGIEAYITRKTTRKSSYSGIRKLLLKRYILANGIDRLVEGLGDVKCSRVSSGRKKSCTCSPCHSTVIKKLLWTVTVHNT